MKELLIILTFTFTWFQNENQNFQIENGGLIWQKIYENEINQDDLVEQLETSGKFENINKSDNQITANFSNLTIDYKGFGSSEMNTPMYIARSYTNGFVIIDIKENKYRITIKGIKLIQKYSDGLSDGGEMTDLETFALKQGNSKFRTSYLKKPAEILNFTFQNLTNFKSRIKDDKW
jgi:hypothetical protein